MNFIKKNIRNNTDKSLAIQLIYGYSVLLTFVFLVGPFRLSLQLKELPFSVSLIALIPILINLAAIYYNKKGNYKVAKYIVIISPSYAALIISVIFKQYNISNDVFLYLTPRLLTVLIFTAPFIFFGLRHKKDLIISSITILIPTLLFDYLHDYFGVGISTMRYNENSYWFYTIFSSVFSVLLLITLLFFQKTGLLYELKLENANKKLNDEKEDMKSLNEQLEFQSYLFNVLTLTGQNKKLELILDDVLILILSSETLSSSDKGGILLTNAEGKLELIVHKNAPDLFDNCATGKCACGSVIETKESLFIDDKTDSDNSHISALGYYVVPIKDDNTNVLGTINIFVGKGKEKDPYVLVYLEAIAYILSKKIADVKSKQLLKEKNIKIDTQKKKIDSTLSELNKSIDYASHLINSLIPNQNTIDSYFQDCSILYLPRDTVSGDFYFTHKHNDHLYFGVGDCTGHGIPGAILASMSIELVKSVIQNNSDEKPDVLLTKIRAVTSSRFDTNTFNERSDSMDAALCMYDKQSEKLFFSGGFISLIIVDIDGNIVEYKATKCPIGSYIIERDFELHQVNLNKGDTIYLASDGYIDQFGYEYIDGVKKNKPSKYKRKRFYQLIKEHHNSSSKIQTSVFEAEINKWRDGIEQIDDITIMIVKH